MEKIVDWANTLPDFLSGMSDDEFEMVRFYLEHQIKHEQELRK